jgi:hypothetical protein
MPAQLVQIEGPGARRRIRLTRERTLLGRDPEVDVCIDSESVSRRHAVLQTVGRGHEIGDLGSLNGTQVNGRRLEGFVLLRPGDRVELADEVTFVYEERRGGAGRVAAALLLLAVVAAAGAAGWRWWQARPDAVLDHASIIARGAVGSWRQGDADAARRGLQAAAGVLYTGGRLDDVPRGRLMPAAFAMIETTLAEPVDLSAIFAQTLAAQARELETRAKQVEVEAPAAEEEQDCRLERVTAERLDLCVDGWLRKVLVKLRQDPDEMPPEFVRVVAQRMQRERGFIARSLARGQPVVPMLKEELAGSNMPELLHYVALIESGYRPTAGSSAGAVGIWQFMPGTARHYGLRVEGDLDERQDPRKSTRAAARYLRDLVFEFGGNAMLLALASYNRGENAVRRALKQLDDPFSDRSYWRLVEEGLLPEETADYVPRFLAGAVAGEGGLPDEAVLAAAGYEAPATAAPTGQASAGAGAAAAP